MEYNYGNLIKIERMRRNMKQSVLARGVCSISYLSKIENNQTTPSEEVLEMIFKRLEIDVPLYYDFSEQVEKVKYEIQGLLKEAILSRKDWDRQKEVEKYLLNPVVNQSKELYVTLLLALARFEMMPGREGKYFKEIGWIEDQLDRDDLLRYGLMRCLKLFNENEKEEGLELLEQLNEQLATSGISDWEVADMSYIMGGLYYRCADYLQAVENVKVGLEYFQDHFYLERIVECHLIIGLAHKRRKRFTEALSYYQRAVKVISATDLKNYNGMLYNNMGEVYSSLGDQEKALEYFMRSFEYKQEVKSKLFSVLSLIEGYTNYDNSTEILNWLEKGYELKGDKEGLEEFDHHFEIYKNYYQEQDKIKLIGTLKKAVQYFELYDDYVYIEKYALWLARELRENGKYKLATEYYEKVIAIRSQAD
ncbi:MULTISPECIES: helix-turn-helix domain-containing protein [unclassified Exiguobacterium]|uniref:helix-turn-helix domain-containing protein n=1 Tax=unclassified Exiguobacterium TaxID=2644629 RepID=UPI00103A5AEF|nr:MULTISPECIES: helix-turn-helix transcriptional regulator [unclassified Exiguobacterium]TCI66606.1 XRE family transcriptional regulator [Exiguobacterium sp. IPCI3]TCI75788.1 XRE family transcriptional regulator [Exiguobacterium sp. IPCH1]TCI76733.1 XRE family transcriptional regulator [Exiguobacterium sp. IPBC4]